ncbi:MAG TPA: SGNH/GDSL hydrolase family protein [Thermoanaerobaculia bacterium]|nr:SGNH/GDSL hydrolase family protein [Thermoanaerobaculia bacterium]
MIRTSKSATLLAALLALTSLASPAVAQSPAARGRADFSRFVALGDSYGAGLTNGSLVFTHQRYSPPAVIARQAGAIDFQQPLVSDPGIGPELEVTNILSFPPRIVPKSPSNGSPLNLNLPRPYNNLSIPGARVNDLLTLTGREPANSTPRVFGQFILRGLGGTAIDQALALNPTFIYLWIGGNDALGAVLSGTPAALTPLADFSRDYNLVLDKLTAGAPNAGIVIGTLPAIPIATVPVAGSVAPFLINPATRLPVLGPDGKPIYYLADLGGGQFGQLPVGSLVLLTAATKLGSGFGIPSALAPLFPSLPDVGKPLSDNDVLTPAEQAAIEARVGEYNNVITAAAAARNIPVADVSGLFKRIQAGASYGGIPIDSSYLTGGFYSYDGFHLTDIGYTLFANEFIRAINRGYRTRIAFASISEFFANNAPEVTADLKVYPAIPLSISAEAVEQIRSFAARVQEVALAPEAEPEPVSGNDQ